MQAMRKTIEWERLEISSKKIGDIKGTFQEKMDTIRGRNERDLTKAEEIKERQSEYTEELYKKGLIDLQNLNGLITHLEPVILGCEVKRALGNIITNKASEGDGIPAELSQILKDDTVKVLNSVCQQIGETEQWLWDWKKSVFIPILKKGSAKNIQITRQLCLYHMLVRVCSKSFKLGFSSM